MVRCKDVVLSYYRAAEKKKLTRNEEVDRGREWKTRRKALAAANMLLLSFQRQCTRARGSALKARRTCQPRPGGLIHGSAITLGGFKPQTRPFPPTVKVPHLAAALRNPLIKNST